MEAQKMDGLKIVELVCLYQMYYSETKNENLKSFSAWLSKNAEGNGNDEETASEEIMNISIIDSLIRISKFIKLFHKDVFNQHQIKTFEEYKFLQTIKMMENPAKSDVYTSTITELTTGAKIMKRLIEMGFVKEFDDKIDKRIKRIKLTNKGLKEISDVESSIHLNNDKILSFTPIQDKTILLQILNSMNGYHTELYNTNPEKFTSL